MTFTSIRTGNFRLQSEEGMMKSRTALFSIPALRMRSFQKRAASAHQPRSGVEGYERSRLPCPRQKYRPLTPGE